MLDRINQRYYTGFRILGPPDGEMQVYWHQGAVRGQLPLCLELSNHSPTGFNWGYSGSGAAQLALALCYDLLGDANRAMDLHQIVKRELVSQFPYQCWILSAGALMDVIAVIEGK